MILCMLYVVCGCWMLIYKDDALTIYIGNKPFGALLPFSFSFSVTINLILHSEWTTMRYATKKGSNLWFRALYKNEYPQVWVSACLELVLMDQPYFFSPQWNFHTNSHEFTFQGNIILFFFAFRKLKRIRGLGIMSKYLREIFLYSLSNRKSLESLSRKKTD